MGISNGVINGGSASITVSGSSTKSKHRNHYPDEYSLVEIVYVDGTNAAFTVSAGLGIANYLRDELRDHHCLTLRNDTDVMIVTREQLRSFTMRRLTQENK